jgi:hypothetical protein
LQLLLLAFHPPRRSRELQSHSRSHLIHIGRIGEGVQQEINVCANTYFESKQQKYILLAIILLKKLNIKKKGRKVYHFKIVEATHNKKAFRNNIYIMVMCLKGSSQG